MAAGGDVGVDAGAGTSAAALRARVPSVVLPFLTFIDQARWARWL